ncbi:flagellar basal body rod protein FlgB [Desulfitobacterium metallireducens]|uniref:Flagellar basal body rod protein FlgB n=1 Tax=Desulfitobacterium metallireducens DSM 15288 TaxID=871968 RepID=W0EE32_9FIRM|nr:flagellar basal body rod protein FlgB [Desulfitobacterium metallireducens]AHF07763.1 flagellar basal-body rod protein FlgB [Desulfitobacterium metallireducens DSM 15288]
MSGWLSNPIMTVLEKGLDASSLRQKVLSDNIANVDTPNFKRSDVDFQQILGEALGEPGPNLPLKITSPQHIQGVSGKGQSGVVKDETTTFRNDGNNVDIDREMANVAENSLYYNSVTQTVSNQLGLLRMAIDGK